MDSITIKQEPITKHLQPSVTFFTTMQKDRDQAQARTSSVAAMDDNDQSDATIEISDDEVPSSNKRKSSEGDDDILPTTKRVYAKEYAFYHCITPNRMLSSSANSSYKTPGADYVLCSIKHTKQATGNGSGEHFHSIVRFDARQVDQSNKNKRGSIYFYYIQLLIHYIFKASQIKLEARPRELMISRNIAMWSTTSEEDTKTSGPIELKMRPKNGRSTSTTKPNDLMPVNMMLRRRL